MPRYDAVVVGSGPNGLTAAILLARAKCSVLLLEASEAPGGGLRSAALTRPGFVHDLCSTIHALAVSSPVFHDFPLADYGLNWVHPPAPLAHPLDSGDAVMLERSVEDTAVGLGADGRTYRRLLRPFVDRWHELLIDALGPLRWPGHPLLLARFAWQGLGSAQRLLSGFTSARARALFAGLAAHAIMPLEQPPTAAVGLMLAAAGHAGGWPVARGGSQTLADALIAYFRRLGGELRTGIRVESLDEIPAARAVLCDVTPRQLLRMAGHRLPHAYRRALERYRYGPGAFKMDWALDGPIPWTAPECRRAATVHLGGTFEEIAESERRAWRGALSLRPFVLLAQQSICDGTRAPAGCETVWAYCHVPHGSGVNMQGAIEAQIERFAPGFCDRILARSIRSPRRLEEENANYVGGDITGGVQDLGQMWRRPARWWAPYETPVRSLYVCSASTPPGGGVHGLCGYYAARAALRRSFGLTATALRRFSDPN